MVVGLDHKSGLSLSILSVDKRQVLALLQTTIHHLMLPSQQIHQLVWRSGKLVKFSLQFRVELRGRVAVVAESGVSSQDWDGLTLIVSLCPCRCVVLRS